jgi:parvulin-like peptidyl-prolyl isomerase
MNFFIQLGKVRLLILVFLTLSALKVDAFAQNKIVAIVNNEIITQKDLDDFINFMRMQLSQESKGKDLETKIQSMKLDLIDRLVEDRLILQEAKKKKITIYPERIKAKLGEIKGRYVLDLEYQSALAKQGLVEADVEARIREQMLMYAIVQAEVKDKVAVDPNEVTEFYNKNITQFKTQETREFESIGLESQEQAREIFEKLKSATDMADFSREYAYEVNKMSAAKGQLMPLIESVVFKLKDKEISDPIKINNKFYIFKLTATIPLRQKTLAESQEDINGILFNKKMQENLAGWLENLKKDAYIKIM